MRTCDILNSLSSIIIITTLCELLGSDCTLVVIFCRERLKQLSLSRLFIQSLNTCCFTFVCNFHHHLESSRTRPEKIRPFWIHARNYISSVGIFCSSRLCNEFRAAFSLFSAQSSTGVGLSSVWLILRLVPCIEFSELLGRLIVDCLEDAFVFHPRRTS